MISESNAAQQVYTAMTQAAQSNVPIPDQSSTPLIETSTSTSGLVPSDTKNARISCVNIEEVNLRVSPGYINKTDNDSIVHVPCGEDVTIINGPSQADGLDWWYVRWNGYQGWMADHTGSGTQILIISP